jgi:hypothetical protein
MAMGGLLVAGTTGGDPSAGVFAFLGVLGMIVGFFVALWVLGAYALAPAAALRGEGPIASCKRSRKLMAGNARMPGGYGTVWGVYSVVGIAALAEWGGISLARELIPFAGNLPGGGLFGELLSLAVPFVVAWTLLPFWGTAVAVIDAERRVRKEGYDVELLAKG